LLIAVQRVFGGREFRIVEYRRLSDRFFGQKRHHIYAIQSIAKETDPMTDYRVTPGEAEEDQFTAAIEKTTSRIPSSAYLVMALGSMAVSATLHGFNKKHESLFIGQWAAPFLLLGIYNKLVKQHGSDAKSRERNQDTGYIGSGETYRSREGSYTQSAGI
jgi:hypothetical protein